MFELTGLLLMGLAVGTFIMMDGSEGKSDEPEAHDDEMAIEDDNNGLLVLTNDVSVSDSFDDLTNESLYLIRSEMAENMHSEEDVVCSGEPGVVDRFDAAFDVIEFYLSLIHI